MKFTEFVLPKPRGKGSDQGQPKASGWHLWRFRSLHLFLLTANVFATTCWAVCPSSTKFHSWGTGSQNAQHGRKRSPKNLLQLQQQIELRWCADLFCTLTVFLYFYFPHPHPLPKRLFCLGVFFRRSIWVLTSVVPFQFTAQVSPTTQQDTKRKAKRKRSKGKGKGR